MKIEAGKYYKTRDGRRVQVHVNRPGEKNVSYPWYHDNGVGDVSGFHGFNPDGTSCINESECDLISEWKDEAPSPIRTVTRREIVPGVYGRVHVGPTDVDSVVVSIGGIGMVGQVQRFTSEELREAAHLLNQIAEVLEENGR